MCPKQEGQTNTQRMFSSLLFCSLLLQHDKNVMCVCVCAQTCGHQMQQKNIISLILNVICSNKNSTTKLNYFTVGFLNPALCICQQEKGSCLDKLLKFCDQVMSTEPLLDGQPSELHEVNT